jgi:hypothetical protein
VFEHSSDVFRRDVGVLPQWSLPLDCIAHDILWRVYHPLVEAEYLAALALGEFM